MASVYFIHNDAVQRVLRLNECIEAIEDAYREWDAGRAAIRAKTNLYVYNLSEEETTRYNFASMEGGVQKLRPRRDPHAFGSAVQYTGPRA